MKLWRLLVVPIIGSDGEKEKKMLAEFAGVLHESNTRMLLACHGNAYNAFVITNEAETAQTIGARWEREYGKPIECEDTPYCGCDRIFCNSDIRALARYCNVSPNSLEKMMEQCYGMQEIQPEAWA